jgi:hypothetical protein
MTEFKTILIEDSRIANITDKETIGSDESGASQCNIFKPFPATSSGDTSSIVLEYVKSLARTSVMDRQLLYAMY